MSSKPLAPGLLLATPKLAEGIFHKAVVMLASHGDDGVLGWILNGRSLGPLQALLRDSGLTPAGVTIPETKSYQGVVQAGGPVSPRSAWVLYWGEPKWEHKAEIRLTGHWMASGDRSIVEAIARGQGPEPFQLLLGYAGWGPGQLESEISEGMWMPADVNEDVAFGDTTGDDKWLRAYSVCVGVSPYAFIASNKALA